MNFRQPEGPDWKSLVAKALATNSSLQNRQFHPITKKARNPVPQPAISTVLIGNPGVGKSTLLNTLLGRVAFKSGISFGNGLTQILQIERDEAGNSLIDTPGLSDVELRQKAAEEIKKALTRGGHFKIIFVITLEAGRIRPDDKTTMKLVLQAADMINRNYSIIINKAPEEIIEFARVTEQREKLLSLLNHGLPGTECVYFNSYDRTLDCVKDTKSSLDERLKKFLKEAPTLKIVREDVKDIQVNEFDVIRNVMSKKLKELEENNKRLLKQVEDKEKQMREMVNEQKKLTEQNEKMFKTRLEDQGNKFKELIEKQQRDSVEKEKILLKKFEDQDKMIQDLQVKQMNQSPGKISDDKVTKGDSSSPTTAKGTITEIDWYDHSEIEIEGSFSYCISNSKVILKLDKISNQSAAKKGVSGTLHVKVFATWSQYEGHERLRGYMIAEHRLGELEIGYSFTNINRTLNYYKPPKGSYKLVLAVTEYGSGIVSYRNLREELRVD